MTPESRNSPLLDNGSLTHVSVTSRNIPLLYNGWLKHVSAATDKKQNNRETVRHGDLYSVRPEVIKSYMLCSAQGSPVWRRDRIPPP
jgi:hypothetical protein